MRCCGRRGGGKGNEESRPPQRAVPMYLCAKHSASSTKQKFSLPLGLGRKPCGLRIASFAIKGLQKNSPLFSIFEFFYDFVSQAQNMHSVHQADFEIYAIVSAIYGDNRGFFAFQRSVKDFYPIIYVELHVNNRN